jgi:hypothetical protein
VRLNTAYGRTARCCRLGHISIAPGSHPDRDTEDVCDILPPLSGRGIERRDEILHPCIDCCGQQSDVIIATSPLAVSALLDNLLMQQTGLHILEGSGDGAEPSESPAFLQRFGNWICFHPQVTEETPTLLGSYPKPTKWHALRVVSVSYILFWAGTAPSASLHGHHPPPRGIHSGT